MSEWQRGCTNLNTARLGEARIWSSRRLSLFARSGPNSVICSLLALQTFFIFVVLKSISTCALESNYNLIRYKKQDLCYNHCITASGDKRSASTVCSRLGELKVMAENTRRSKIKVFKHGDTSPGILQPTLADACFKNHGDCPSKLTSLRVPPSGADVMVRPASTDSVQILWGNDLVANITGALGKELADAIAFSRKPSGIKSATVVSSDLSRSELVIRFTEQMP